MKVKDLIKELSDLPQDADVVVQQNQKNGYFSLHKFIIQPTGHVGYNGPIIQVGEQIESDYALEKAKEVL